MVSDSVTPQPPEDLAESPSEVTLPGSEADEVEYNGPLGEFGAAEEASTDDFEVDEDDEEWGV